MNGISMAISKPCCPMYNVGIITKISLGSSNKIDLIPTRLSNLHLYRISSSVTTKHMLKHRVFSSRASLRSESPEVTIAVVPYLLLGIGIYIAGIIQKHEIVAHAISTMRVIKGVLKSNPRYSILLGIVAVLFVAKGFISNVMRAFAVLHAKPFTIGDTVQVGDLKGEVTNMGVNETTVLTAEKIHVVLPTRWYYGLAIKNYSRATTIVPCSLLCDQVFEDESSLPWHSVESKIELCLDDMKKIPQIAKDLKEMMRSYPDIYLENYSPSCVFLELKSGCVVLNIEFDLKKLKSEHKLNLAKQDILLKSIKIIKKFGAIVGGEHIGGKVNK